MTLGGTPVTRITILGWLLVALAGTALECNGGNINSGGDGDGDGDVDGDADGDSDADTEVCPGGCPTDQVCHEGTCVDPAELCEDVVCPPGERCNLGRCIPGDDPCAEVECPPGSVCRDGECVAGEADEDMDGFIARDDCNDHDPEIHPGAEERCNGLDDDCDEGIDESFDSDGDGFPSCEESPVEIRDCNDEDAWIHPGSAERCNGLDDDCDGEVDEDDPGSGAPCGETTGACEEGIEHCVEGSLQCIGAIGPRSELCNGEDDDCNGLTDDGDVVATCPVPPHAIIDCVAGACRLVGCEDGFANLNPSDDDGCETPLDPYPDICASAFEVETVGDDGTTRELTGTIAPAGDVDWITFRANDTADGECDRYHLRIEFVTNPGNAYSMEVRRGGCRAAAECGMPAVGTYEFFTDFRGDVGGETRGECPCTAAPGAPGANWCGDQSTPYVVRIFRNDGGSSSDEYRVRIRNP
jgi:hypothetical protein